MSELRRDPISGRWVIIAQERAERPQAFVAQASSLCDSSNAAVVKRDDCPFCPGNESQTPPDLPPSSGSEGWLYRVFPNKFPALAVGGAFEHRSDGFLHWGHGLGAHEVVVESPEHVVSTSQLSLLQVHTTLYVYSQRLIELQRDPRLKHATIFKNVGAAAGATIEHTHSQILTLPLVPSGIQEQLDRAKQFFDEHGRCIFCYLIAGELVDGRRIVADSPEALAFCPYASRFPYETWIVPKTHVSHFERSLNTMHQVAAALREAIVRIESAANRPAYNYYVRTAPFDSQPLDHYHWHIEIVPRLTQVAGFEWATGMFINPVAPEEAAARLREAMLC